MARSSIQPVRDSAMTFSGLAARYIQHLGAYKGYSPRTCDCYGLTYAQFRGYLQMQGATDDVRHFDAEHCEGFAKALSAGGMKPNSVNVKLAGLSSLAAYAMKVKLPTGKYVLDENPMTRFDRPQKQRVSRKFLYRDELDRLRALPCAPNESLLRDLFIDTGLRASELTRANVEDLWMDAKERVIVSVSVKGRGRAEEKVPVSLGADVAARLVESIRHREASGKDPLVVNQAGARYTRSAAYEVIGRLARRAGIDRFKVGSHTLRHAFNTLGLAAGLSVPVQAALLNHSDTGTVQKYQHLQPDELFDARERVREVLRG